MSLPFKLPEIKVPSISKPLSRVVLDASVEHKNVVIGSDVDFVFLKYVPSGVQVWVSVDGSDLIDIVMVRALFNPTSKWKVVTVTTKGTANDRIEFYLGGEAKVSSYVTTVPNIDIPLSTRASEATLLRIANALNSVGTDQMLARIASTAIIMPVDIQTHYKAPITLLSGTITASGQTSDIDVSRFDACEGAINVTAVSGTTPSLDIYIEGKEEATGLYKVLVSQTGITAVGSYFFTISQLIFRYVRVRYVVSGTSPSFTVVVGMTCKA